MGQLEEMYEVVLTVPGRVPTSQLKIVHAVPKGQEAASNIVPDQQHKLFIVSAPAVNESDQQVVLWSELRLKGSRFRV